MTGSAPLRLLAICGSLRAGSYNHAVLATLPELLPEGVTLDIYPGYADIPVYNADDQAAGFPASVTALGAAIAAADGIVIAAPEYNYSVPGGLKNAIDWVSRLSPQPFAGKPVSLMSASMGVLGGARMQYHLRQILVFLDAEPMNKPEVFIGAVHQKVADGKLTEPGTRKFLAEHMAAFATWTRRRKD